MNEYSSRPRRLLKGAIVTAEALEGTVVGRPETTPRQNFLLGSQEMMQASINMQEATRNFLNASTKLSDSASILDKIVDRLEGQLNRLENMEIGRIYRGY